MAETSVNKKVDGEKTDAGLTSSVPVVKGKKLVKPAKPTEIKAGPSNAESCNTSSPSSFNKEALLILREMNANINKTNEKVEQLSTRVDAIYDCDYECYDDYEAADECDYGQPEETRSVSLSEAAGKRPLSEPDCEENVFTAIVKKFKRADQCDKSVNQTLADLVNVTFKEGMPEENFNEAIKSIYRPENCESLKETRVNTGVWSVLRPQTQTEDSKMRGIQNCVVKAACNVTKLLEENSSLMTPQSLELGTTALGLMGQANKWINVRRRELHKKDMDPKLHHLCSSSIPFSDLLYGDTIVKDIKDIQEINKISKNVGTTRGYRGRGRGGRFRARGRPYQRRGFSGYGNNKGPNSNDRSKNWQRAEPSKK